MTCKSNHHILAIKHLHLVQVFVHSIKLLLHSDQFCNAILREWYSFAFGIILDLGYVNRIEIENSAVQPLHLLILQFTFANAKVLGFIEFTGNMVIVKAHKHVLQNFVLSKNLWISWKICWSVCISLGINLEKTVWCSCSYRYSCHEQAGWVVSKQLATWW